MQIRTDLALERKELCEEDAVGVQSEERVMGEVKLSRIQILNQAGEKALGKPKGEYITIEMPSLSDNGGTFDDAHHAIVEMLAKLLPAKGTVLVVGLGNTAITPDALGPKVANGVLATRHIPEEFAHSVGLTDLRSVAVLWPGVLGQTGIETLEIIKGTVERIHPVAVLAVDALASRRLNRLGCTVQMADSGISPGSGVGNARREISKASLGIPVVSIGVPTVVDAATLVQDLITQPMDIEATIAPQGRQMIVTPREIDLMIDRAAELLSHAINCALHPAVSPEVLRALV